VLQACSPSTHHLAAAGLLVLGTFIIGLREGLEAALVVGILATFLRRNGASLRAMWWGVVAAVVVSVGVGVTLELVSASLPQRAQEGMETVISAVAVVFVTSMIVWMSKHARGLKKELEASADAAMRDGTVWALVAMAFLAVLKEGFETSVFLLATFQAAQSTTLAVGGAVLGLLCAAAVGVGIYHGGIRFNIGRFFTFTGIFLVFVAAGLVLTTFRTAHEAGWVTIGQARTVDLSWLAPAGSVRSALVTGVLGVPADPRAIEVVAYLGFLLPVLALVLWPARWRPSLQRAPRVRFLTAAGLAVAALATAVLVPSVPAVAASALGPAPVVSSGATKSPLGTALLAEGAVSLVLTSTDGTATTVDLVDAERIRTEARGVSVTELRADTAVAASTLPATLTLADLAALSGGRLPVGINAERNPGPFDAAWTQRAVTTLRVAQDDVLVDAASSATTAVTLTGGGLPQSRTVSVDATGLAALGTDATAAAGTAGPAGTSALAATSWTVAPDHAAAVAAALSTQRKAAAERALYTTYIPLALLLAALGAAGAGLVSRRRLRSAVSAPRPDQAARPSSALENEADRHRTRSTADVV